ncbi:MAG: T9SS C-terminal target domain-containing protein [Calditrichaeota bacterium]|nr:MAG: T9SS C-terminal target domain-containing protein [Calditrichota bacterium]
MKILIFLTILLVSNVFGAIHTVTSSNDSGIGTLREKIEISANGDTILFSNNVNTVWLSGEPYLLDEKALTIDGGSNGVTINRFAGIGGFFELFSQDLTFIDTTYFANLSLINGDGDTDSAIFNIGMNMEIENCDILNYINGRILHILGTKYVKAINSNFHNNTGDCYFLAVSSVLIENISFQSNNGSFIIDSDTLDFNKSLITGNISSSSSFILFTKNGLIKNSTITGNSNEALVNNGSGIYFFDSSNVEIQNCTITDNSILSGQLGGGIYNEGGNVTIRNSIIANNTAGGSPSNLSGDFVSGGFNIIADTSGSTITGQTFVDFYNVDSTSLGLLPLADNGGFTETIGLSPNSIAFNNGSQLNSPLTDQRGFLRDSLPDIGAFEFNAVSRIEENEFVSPELFQLSQNFPNPFNPQTLINYELGNWNYESKLVIFNILGEKVKEFTLSETQGTVVWNGTNFGNKQVSSGVYFYRIETGNKFSQTKKMVFIK